MLAQRTDLLASRLYHNSLREWLIALAVALGVYLLLATVRHEAVRRLRKIAERTATHLDDLFVELIDRTRAYFLAALAVEVALKLLDLPTRVDHRVDKGVVLLALFQMGAWGQGVIAHFVNHHMEQRRRAGEVSSLTTIRAVGIAARVFLGALLLLAALDNVGFDVTALVTGLGIGGIAIALAVQNVLGDLLAALSIVFDKPFVVGDTITVDNLTGTVEHVGIKTTRVRSVGGEQIIFSNTDLLKSRVRNFKRMYERRVLFHLDVTYDTPPALVARIPAILREVIEAHQPVRFDRCHFSAFTDSALRIETVYYVLDPDYVRHMDIQQSIYLVTLGRFQAEGIRFAFPTRTLVMEGVAPPPGFTLGAGPGLVAKR